MRPYAFKWCETTFDRVAWSFLATAIWLLTGAMVFMLLALPYSGGPAVGAIGNVITVGVFCIAYKRSKEW